MTTNEKRENVFKKIKYSSTNRRKERGAREKKKKKVVDFGMVTVVE
jgi:hypothetical protein